MPAITPSLWFDNNLEEAVEFYTTVFPNSHIEGLNRYTDAGPGQSGAVMSGTFVLDGARFIAINGGRSFRSPRRSRSPSTARTRTRSIITGSA